MEETEREEMRFCSNYLSSQQSSLLSWRGYEHSLKREGNLVQWENSPPLYYCGLVLLCADTRISGFIWILFCMFNKLLMANIISKRAQRVMQLSSNFRRGDNIRKAAFSTITPSQRAHEKILSLPVSFTLYFCLSRNSECNSAIRGINLKRLIHKLIKHVYFSSCGVVGINICEETCTPAVNELSWNELS